MDGLYIGTYLLGILSVAWGFSVNLTCIPNQNNGQHMATNTHNLIDQI